MIDDRSEPGAWVDAMRFPNSIRVIDADEACRFGPLLGPAAHFGAAESHEGSAAALSDHLVAHAAAITANVGE